VLRRRLAASVRIASLIPPRICSPRSPSALAGSALLDRPMNSLKALFTLRPCAELSRLALVGMCFHGVIPRNEKRHPDFVECRPQVIVEIDDWPPVSAVSLATKEHNGPND
jgi:hypothetical protein